MKEKAKHVRVSEEIYKRLKAHVAIEGGTMGGYVDGVLDKNLPTYNFVAKVKAKKK